MIVILDIQDKYKVTIYPSLKKACAYNNQLAFNYLKDIRFNEFPTLYKHYWISRIKFSAYYAAMIIREMKANRDKSVIVKRVKKDKIGSPVVLPKVKSTTGRL